MRRIVLFILIIALALTGCSSTTTLVDFSNLSTVTPSGSTVPVNVGDVFKVGDILIEKNSQVKFAVLPFQWGSAVQHPMCPAGVLGWTPEGYVDIVQDNMAGGSGTELHFNNATLGIIAPTGTKVTDIKLKFGDYGGNINLIAKGTIYNYNSFGLIPGIPTLNLVVSSGLPKGILNLSGDIGQFYYTFPCPAFFPIQQYTAVVGGGQELWIDDIEFTLKK